MNGEVTYRERSPVVLEYGDITSDSDSDAEVVLTNPEVKKYSSIVAYSFVINYVLGVGILEMPYAFLKSGLLFGLGFLLLVTVITVVAVMWVVESGSRAQALARSDAIGNREDTLTEKNRLMNGAPRTAINTDQYDEPNFELGDDLHFEFNQLCKIFLGRWGKLGYEAVLVFYMWGTLISFANVFTSSMTAYIPIPGLSLHHDCDIYETGLHWTDICEYTYLLYILIFAVLTIPFACMDLTDQILLQVFLTVVRYVGLFLMYITLILGMANGPYENHDVSGPPYIANRSLFNISGFSIIFGTAVFSQLFQHSAPGLARPVRNKSKMPYIFGGALISTMILYSILGIMASMYFGDDTKQLISLNWDSYSGNDFAGKSHANLPAKIASYVVVLFPVITVTSGFPLFGITMGNNIYNGLPDKWTNNRTSKKVKIACRLVSVIPPLIAACGIKDLAIIVEFTGIAGCFIGFIFPALLQYSSRKMTIQRWGREKGLKTPYSWHGSHPVYAVIIFIFGVLALGFSVIYEIIQLAR
eukprot:TRINITY_DN14036_c0_g1_i1.p1 TRINITY_DN14036_c0_g1~~TRINITY_DN14036_c0_g1_i1.p1  ORF type:complete len:529 (-),score=31.11 TRINITY_DN14036_c0_g1_i1:190-1776(-)